MSKEEFDVDKEIKKISRKTDINIMRSEKAFENRLNKLDKDIDKTIKSKEKIFDESKEVTTQYLTTDYTDSALERYREKLKKI